MEDDEPERLSQRGKEVIRESIRLMMDKIAKYEDLLDANIVGWAAMALDPRYKMRWVAEHLPTRRKDTIMTRLQEYFDDNYPLSVSTPTPEAVLTPAIHPNPSLPSYNGMLPLSLVDEDTILVDELSDYLGQPLNRQLEEDSIIPWWISQKARWPRLFCMAMDLLSIPSMSSENERSFSQAKLILTTQRQRLHHTTLGKLVCLKSWNKDGSFLEGWERTF